MFTICFATQVRDWLIRLVLVGINQSRTIIVKDIINLENCYVIYLLRIIVLQNEFSILSHIAKKLQARQYLPNWLLQFLIFGLISGEKFELFFSLNFIFFKLERLDQVAYSDKQFYKN